MISYHAYKVIHLTSVFMIVLSLGGMAVHAFNGGGREHPFRKAIAVTHGVGMTLALLAGFGLIARLDVPLWPWPPLWVIGKLSIWLILGGLVSPILRRPQWGKTLWIAIIVLTAAAAYLANYKPV